MLKNRLGVYAPRKDGKTEKPMFNYEKLLYDSLLIPNFYNPMQFAFKHKHLWVKKGGPEEKGLNAI
jgi:hypothetical protein